MTPHTCNCFPSSYYTITMPPPSQSISILPDHLMHKNRLQEYAQKSALPLPVYKTVNEGFPHAPKFRSSVLVDGTNYSSNLTFMHRKAAEQEVAKYALERIAKKTIECPPITKLEDPMGCKSILLEFAIKSKRTIPTYKTRCEGGLGPVFVSSVLFEGKLYTGEVAGSKKLAEQLAAGAAIRALVGELEGCNSGKLLHEIVKSKGKLTCVHELSITKPPIAFQPTESWPHEKRNSPETTKQVVLYSETSGQKPTMTNFNSRDRGVSGAPYTVTEEKRITGAQMVESKERGKRATNETGNVASNYNKRFNTSRSCARVTGPSKSNVGEPKCKNQQPKKRFFNSLGIMVGHNHNANQEGKRKFGTHP